MTTVDDQNRPSKGTKRRLVVEKVAQHERGRKITGGEKEVKEGKVD